MCAINSCEPSSKPHIELAIAVFKKHDKALVNSLKNFLTLLPTSNCVEDVLKSAICQLAASDPEDCRWLLRNAPCLEPELDLIQFVMETVSTQFQNEGFKLDRDFWFDPCDRLCLNIRGKATIIVDGLSGEFSLLENIFLHRQQHFQSQQDNPNG
jgi:hypothetical protein